MAERRVETAGGALERERFERLPKWAQRKIETLNIDLEAAKRRIEAMAGRTDEPTEVSIRGYIADSDTPLPPHSVIQFVDETGQSYEVRMTDDQGLRVSLGGARGDALHVVPSAANSVFLRDGAYSRR